MKPRTHPLDQELWKKRLQKSGNFMVILAVNLAFFLLLGTAVIWHLVPHHDDLPMTFVKVKAQVIPPARPPAHGGEAAKSSLDPTVTVTPPTTSVSSVVVSNNPAASFTMQSLDVPVSTVSLPSFSTQPTGSGLGQGSGATGIAHSNPFGDAVQDGVPGLIGQLYDLKQTPDGTPTKLALQSNESPNTLSPGWQSFPVTRADVEVVHNYVKNWDQDILDQYYKSPVSLQATQLFIPVRPSVEATKAFGVADKVIAKRWIIHYHATIVPPKTGRFRFLGFGDDFLVVRLGSENVLDGSFPGELVDPSANAKDDGIPGPVGYSASAEFDMRCGKWVDMVQGSAQSIDILIGEGPGGVSSFYLLIQQDSDAKTDYSVFQIAPTELPKITKLSPDFTGKTMVFTAQ